MKAKTILLIILTISLSNCTHYVTPPLPLPSESVQKPYNQDLECLDTNTRQIVVKAYKRIETLEAWLDRATAAGYKMMGKKA